MALARGAGALVQKRHVVAKAGEVAAERRGKKGVESVNERAARVETVPKRTEKWQKGSEKCRSMGAEAVVIGRKNADRGVATHVIVRR